MSWKEVNPMQQKILFIADYLRQLSSMSELCYRYGISRKTGYKWVKRFEHSGIDGLSEQSRRPLMSPVQTPYRIQQKIIELRQQYSTRPGSKKLQILLAQCFPHEHIPSKTTIYNILNRAGLIDARKPKRRVSLYPQPFSPVQEVNELWSVDYKGQFKLGNGQWCYPLTVMDHQSRFLFCCKCLKGPLYKETRASFTKLFRQYGLPARIRSDNGIPFASVSRGGLSKLSIWWIKLNIAPERIAPGKPQQNGRHERMHRTLKQAATRPASANMRSQQRRFDAFCEEYNQHRPHEALGQKTPSSQYTRATREYPEKLPEIHYPEYFEVKKVSSNGTACWQNKMIYVSHLLHGEYIGLEEIDEGSWEVYFGPVKLGQFNEQQLSGKNNAYISIKV